MGKAKTSSSDLVLQCWNGYDWALSSSEEEQRSLQGHAQEQELRVGFGSSFARPSSHWAHMTTQQQNTGSVTMKKGATTIKTRKVREQKRNQTINQMQINQMQTYHLPLQTNTEGKRGIIHSLPVAIKQQKSKNKWAKTSAETKRNTKHERTHGGVPFFLKVWFFVLWFVCVLVRSWQIVLLLYVQ